MDGQSGEPLLLSANEYTLYSHASVKMSLTAGSGFPADTICIESDDGALYITSYRVVYIPDLRQNTTFASFSCGIDDEQATFEAENGQTCVMACMLIESGKLATITFAFPGQGDAQLACDAFQSVKTGSVKSSKN